MQHGDRKSSASKSKRKFSMSHLPIHKGSEPAEKAEPAVRRRLTRYGFYSMSIRYCSPDVRTMWSSGSREVELRLDVEDLRTVWARVPSGDFIQVPAAHKEYARGRTLEAHKAIPKQVRTKMKQTRAARSEYIAELLRTECDLIARADAERATRLSK